MSFVVHPNEVPAELSTSHIGARYMIALVQVGDDELPIKKPAKGIKTFTAAPPPVDPKPAGAKRTWVELKPSTSAAIRGNEATFRAYLNEECGFNVEDSEQAAVVIRQLCRVDSRTELNTDPEAALRWKALDDQYLAWKALEHA